MTTAALSRNKAEILRCDPKHWYAMRNRGVAHSLAGSDDRAIMVAEAKLKKG